MQRGPLDRNEVAGLIRAEFAEAPRLGPTEEVGWEFSDEDFDEFRGRDWREIEHEQLRHMANNLLWVHRRAIRYFMPALLLAALDDTDIRNMVVWYLDPDRYSEKVRSEIRANFQTFSLGERWAVRAFLEHIRDNMASRQEDAQSALAHYWHDLGGLEPRGETG